MSNIGKKYRLGERNNYRTMRDSISKFTTQIFRNMGSLSNGNYNLPRLRKKQYETASYIWSLKNITFNVDRGEIIGIIGSNGAGKSTLLKLITGITMPDEGRIEIHGRIASLLEVGTGFHFELTGRENIYLNGAILGMKKREIDKKFNEIVEFSEVEQFIDTPVKYYSSGMRVRLGFSVAAHLEPENLLIDEVLAVGDAAFQKKCLGKLNNVATHQGRTVLFVSHDMAAILSLCPRAILLANGQIIDDSSTDNVVQKYMQTMAMSAETPLDLRTDRSGDQSVLIESLRIENNNQAEAIKSGCKLRITIKYRSINQIRYPRLILRIFDYKTRSALVYLDTDAVNGLPELLPSSGIITCVSEKLNLTPGRCSVDIEFKKGSITADKVEFAGYFDIEASDVFGTGKIPTRAQASFLLESKWSFIKE